RCPRTREPVELGTCSKPWVRSPANLPKPPFIGSWRPEVSETRAPAVAYRWRLRSSHRLGAAREGNTDRSNSGMRAALANGCRRRGTRHEVVVLHSLGNQ